MRRSNTVLLTMGSAMLISSSVALAAPPISYGQYSATAGAITPSACPTGFSCGAAITGDGFLQRQVTETSSGNVYFQTIILDKGSTIADGTNLGTATFADESFVQQGGGTGIADSSHVYSPAAVGAADQSNFTSNAQILVGTQFKDPTDNLIQVNQTINDPTTLTNVDFQLEDASTDNTQPVITIDSTVYLTPGGSGTPAATDPRQRFYLKQLKATAGGNLADLGTGATVTPDTTAVPLGYAANDIIQVLWLGQTVATDNTDPSIVQPFGVQSFSVNPNGTTTTATTPTAVQQLSSQSAVGSNPTVADPYGTQPFVWDTVFGATQPVF